MDTVSIVEKPEIIDFGLLRGVRGGSKNACTVGNGHHPGAAPGNVGGAGKPVPRTDAWHRRVARGASKARQLAGSGAATPDKAPHLIHGGPYPILPGWNVFFQDRHAGMPAAMTRVTAGRLGEVPRAAAPRPEAAGAEAAVVGAKPIAAASIRGRG